jgi:hypothetical protein
MDARRNVRNSALSIFGIQTSSSGVLLEARPSGLLKMEGLHISIRLTDLLKRSSKRLHVSQPIGCLRAPLGYGIEVGYCFSTPRLRTIGTVDIEVGRHRTYVTAIPDVLLADVLLAGC